MYQNSTELYQLLPFLVIGSGILISIIIEILSKKSEVILPWFSILLFAITTVFSIININHQSTLFNGMLKVGGSASIFNFIFNVAAALVVLGSMNYLIKYGTYYGEYYILIQSAVLGMMMMAGAKDILMIFMGLELMSICFYVLAGINRKKTSANEASIKYFLLGAFATGFIVYGIAFIYGTASTTKIDYVISSFGTLINNPLFIVGFVLFLIGFSFKIAAFPFHMWVPDVYQGSATTVTGIMSTAGKAAAFGVLIIVLTAIFNAQVVNKFRPYFAVIATFSMLYGSIVAIAQDNIKRMLAYSSIAHAGYMSIGLAAGNVSSEAGIIFYLAAYTFMNIGAFEVVAMIEGENDSQLGIKSYIGLGNKNPILAAFMALFMFALAGIPPLAGFFGKYYVFIGAIEGNLTWLAIIGVISSIISVYFYLRIVVYMYFREPVETIKFNFDNFGLTTVAICGLLVLIFGLFPDTLLNLIISIITIK